MADIPIPWDIAICILLGFIVSMYLTKKRNFRPVFALALTFFIGALVGYEIINIVPVAYTSVNTLLSTTDPSLQILVATGQISTLAQLVAYANIAVWILVFMDGVAALVGSFIATRVMQYRKKT